MNARVRIDAAAEAIVADILARHLPADVRAFAFGSRTTDSTKPFSDLDLVLEGDGPVSLAVIAELAEAFDESALPWKVDLVDRATVSAEFAAIIDRAKLPIG